MLKEKASNPKTKTEEVLILILMEHAQRVFADVENKKGLRSLNPYFNGTCSKSLPTRLRGYPLLCLNPYFNGTCSKRLWII